MHAGQPRRPGHVAGSRQQERRQGTAAGAALERDRHRQRSAQRAKPAAASIAPIGGDAADQRLLDSLLGPGTATLDTRNASLIGQVSLGTQSWVSIGGTLARVRLIPTAQLRGGLPPEWNSGSLSLGAGVGNFGGEITGQLIEVPGQPSRYSSLGAGVTWRTPWRAKVSVGADNIISTRQESVRPAGCTARSRQRRRPRALRALPAGPLSPLPRRPRCLV